MTHQPSLKVSKLSPERSVLAQGHTTECRWYPDVCPSGWEPLSQLSALHVGDISKNLSSTQLCPSALSPPSTLLQVAVVPASCLRFGTWSLLVVQAEAGKSLVAMTEGSVKTEHSWLFQRYNRQASVWRELCARHRAQHYSICSESFNPLRKEALTYLPKVTQLVGVGAGGIRAGIGQI